MKRVQKEEVDRTEKQFVDGQRDHVPTWKFTRLKEQREWASLPFPWPNNGSPIKQTEIDAFEKQIVEHLKKDWITLMPERIFVHENEEERWIRPPVDGFLSWFDGEKHEVEMDTIASAIRRFNRVVIGWKTNGWNDKPACAGGEFPEPPPPYHRSERIVPDDQHVTSWGLEPTDINSRLGQVNWKWDEASERTSFYLHDKEFGHQGQYRGGDLLLVATIVASKSYGHQFWYRADGGLSSVTVFTDDESISEFDVDRSIVHVSSDLPLEETKKIEFSGNSYKNPWRYPKKSFQVTSKSKLKRGKIEDATAVTLLSFEIDIDVLKAFFARDAFRQVRSLSFGHLKMNAFEFACLLTSGCLDHIEHIKFESIKLDAVTDGVQEAVVANLFGLPALNTIELSNIDFEDKNEHFGPSISISSEQLANGISDAAGSNVEVVILNDLRKVGDQPIVALCELPNLKVLQIARISVGAKGLQAVLDSDIEQFSYTDALCRKDYGLETPFQYGEVHPLFDKLNEKLQTLEVSVDAIRDPIEAGNISDIVQEPPSVDAFRQILKSLQAVQEDPALFETELAVARDGIADWPADVRNPPPYFVNEWVDGSYAFDSISLVGSLRVADLCLETTHKPASRKVTKKRLKTFAKMIQKAPGSVIHLDLTPRAWISAVKPNLKQLTKFKMPLNADFWAAISSAKIFSSLETFDISKPSFDYDPCNSYGYKALHSFMDDYTSDLLLLETLESALFRTTLKSLKLESLDPAYFGDAEISLPELQEIDLSGRARGRAANFLSCIDAPKLKHVELRGDSMTDFVLETKFDDIDDDDYRHALQQNWGISSQEDLDSELIDQKYLDEILKLAPKAKVILAGEIKAKHVKRSKKITEIRYDWPDPIFSW